MRIVNISEIPGRSFEIIGIVRGSAVRAVKRDVFAKWQSLFGGEMKNCAEMLDGMRSLAEKRMTEQAENLYADAIINVTFAGMQIADGVVEIAAYGTAVTFNF
jgi:uncharacterized protein YbjQ (UPF0145 family)